MTNRVSLAARPDPAAERPTSRMLIAQILQGSAESKVNTSVEVLRLVSGAFPAMIDKAELMALFDFAAHRAKIDCPGWLARSADERELFNLEKFRCCLEGDDAGRADATTELFWDAFIGALTALIGEHLTMLQFRLALRPFLTTVCGSAEAG